MNDQSGQDKDIHRDGNLVPRLKELALEMAPRWIALNGKTAAKWVLQRGRVDFGEPPERWGRSRLMVLPLTSGTAKCLWDETVWLAFAKAVKKASIGS